MNEKKIKNLKLNKQSLLRELNDNNVKLNKYAETILNSDFYNYNNENEISIIEISLSELGFPKGECYLNVFKAISEHENLEFCPIEFAPYIRLNYERLDSSQINIKNKHPIDSIIIFSKPLIKEDMFPKGFYIRDIDSEKWLRGFLCSEDYFYEPDTKVILKKSCLK